MKGKLFLSGGGSEKDSYELDKEFVISLDSRKILYIPIAMERDLLGYESCYEWIISSLTQFDDHFVDITMWLDLQGKKVADLYNFDAIYVGGGNTYRLLDKIRSTGFDTLIIKFLENGGIYYGGSAGAIVIGKHIDTVVEENDKKYTYNKGLSMVGNFSFIAHFNKDTAKKKESINNFLTKYKTPVIAIPEGVGIIVEKNRCRVIGKFPITVFYPDGEKKYLPRSSYLDIA